MNKHTSSSLVEHMKEAQIQYNLAMNQPRRSALIPYNKIVNSAFSEDKIQERLIEIERLEKLTRNPKILKLKLPHIKD